MTETHYVKVALILEQCFEVEADSPDDARIKINERVESIGESINGWTIIDYNIEVQDD